MFLFLYFTIDLTSTLPLEHGENNVHTFYMVYACHLNAIFIFQTKPKGKFFIIYSVAFVFTNVKHAPVISHTYQVSTNPSNGSFVQNVIPGTTTSALGYRIIETWRERTIFVIHANEDW